MEPFGQVTDSDDTLPASPAPASPPSRPDRIIGGVAGFIANRLGLDALWVRLGFVVLALAGGIGLLLYAGCWLVLIAGTWNRWLRFAGGAVLLGGIPLLLNAQGNEFVTGPVAIVLLLAGLALALWQPRQAPGEAPVAPFPPPTLPIWPSARTQPAEGVDAEPPGPEAPQRIRHPREPSVLGRITLGVALVLGALWAVADQLDGGRLHPEQWLGGAAAVCGAGLLVGAFVGRARWLVVPAMLLAGTGSAWGQIARLGIDAADTFGDRHTNIGSYTSAAQLTEHAGLGEVQLNIDSKPAQQVHVDARVAVGSIQLWIAQDVTVEVRARVDHGSVRADDRVGIGDESVTTFGPGPTPDVVVDAWVGWGNVEVRRFDWGPPYPVEETVPPLGPTALLPAQAGALVPIRDGVSMTTDGWVVLGDGSAVISPDDQVTVVGDGSVYPTGDGTQTIDTMWGPFRLLPRSLLLTPDQQVIDLRALREELAATATSGAPAPPAPETPVATATVPPPLTTLPPATIPGG